MSNENKPRIVPGASLLPSPVTTRQAERFPYWVGALPDCPWEGVDVGGINFPKLNEVVKRNAHTGKTERIPHVGQVLHLTRVQLERIQSHISRKVFRFHGGVTDEGEEQLKSMGGLVLDGTKRKRGALLLNVPTAAEREAAAKVGKSYTISYEPRDSDRGVAEFVFMVPAVNGQRSAGEEPPPPLSVTGLEMPAEDTQPTANAYQA